MRSCLVDVNAVVINGEFGTPYSIGDYGFYTDMQFQAQATLLFELERINSEGKYFLSDEEWKKVDAYLASLAFHANSKFTKAYRGDTFASLAIRKNAFFVAILFLQNNIDMLLLNEEGKSTFQYLPLSHSG